MIRTVLIHVSTLFIAICVFIYTFTVQPFIERTAVVENTIHYDLYAAAVGLSHKFGKKLVAGFKVFLIGHTVYVAGSMGIVPVTLV